MTIDFVRPMGVPPVREPRPAQTSSNQQVVDIQSTGDSDRPVAPDPIRGHAIDLKA